jgi:hypothetical protein
MPVISKLQALFKKAETPQLDHDSLPDDVLAEVVKDGQAMLSAQFQSHTGLMTRGFTMAGVVLAGTTAMVAALISLGARNAAFLASDWGQIAPICLLLIGSALALMSALPGKYSVPGNEPWCWNLKHWDLAEGVEPSLKAARLSQLAILQSQISKNKRSNRRRAWLQIFSFIAAFAGVLLGAFAYFGAG